MPQVQVGWADCCMQCTSCSLSVNGAPRVRYQSMVHLVSRLEDLTVDDWCTIWPRKNTFVLVRRAKMVGHMRSFQPHTRTRRALTLLLRLVLMASIVSVCVWLAMRRVVPVRALTIAGSACVG